MKILGSGLLLCVVFLALACGQSTQIHSPTNLSGNYWNVVLGGQSTASITFSQPLSSSGLGIISGGSTVFSSSNYNLYISGGGTTGCQIVAPGTTVVTPGAATGTFTLNGPCTNALTSSLIVTLGNSVSAIMDASNNYIVKPGHSVSGVIVPPGATGASTGNVAY